MFKIVCGNCGKESKVTTEDGSITVDGQVSVIVGDWELDLLECDGCTNRLKKEAN